MAAASACASSAPPDEESAALEAPAGSEPTVEAAQPVNAGLPCVTVENAAAYGTTVEDTMLVIDPTDPLKASTNYGAVTQMSVGYSGADYRRILVKFNLGAAGVPANAVIASATLAIRMIQSPGKKPFDIYAASAPWSEATTTWNTMANAPGGGLGALEASVATLGVPNQTMMMVPLSPALVQSWLAAPPGNGLVLDHPQAGRTLFGSSEAPNAGPRPKLTVCYCSPSPELCDGVDNDCDGQVDEGGCDDGNDCTADACTAGACAHVAVADGASCGNDVCVGAATCVGGACQPGRCSDPYIQIARGYATCAVRASGKVECWGSNALGLLGDGTGVTSETPVTVVGIDDAVKVSVANQNHHACALRANGRIACWGYNYNGQLGNGAPLYSSTPVLAPVAVSGITNAVDIVAGNAHTCAALATGQVRCWGSNSSKGLGNGTYNDSSTPVTVLNVTDAVGVAAGWGYSCALRAGGGVKCWGTNSYGNLGTGSSHSTSDAQPVVGLTDALQITAGYDHTCAVRATGEVACWGSNQGNKTGTNHPGIFNLDTPTPVPGITDAVKVTASTTSTCALHAAGNVSCWSPSALPLPVAGMADAIDVATTSDLFDPNPGRPCVVREWGSIACWEEETGDASGFSVVPELCAAGAPPLCNDTNTCTRDVCDAALGCGTVALVGDLCDDHSICTQGDACDATGTCTGPSISCDDSNACTDDSCNPIYGCVASFVPGATCDFCQQGGPAGTPFVCEDDYNDCTVEYCDSNEQGCLYSTAPDGTSCFDVYYGEDGTCQSGYCQPGAVCGDGTCDDVAGETCYNCWDDCYYQCSYCGDNQCDYYAGEPYYCPSDCSYCGDGQCDYNTNEPYDCPSDCGYCGDGYCDYNTGEQYSCPSDCSYCGDGYCDYNTNEPYDCPSDCGPVCGDGFCDDVGGETCYGCWDDCYYECSYDSYCGDGVCDYYSSEPYDCPSDCGYCGDGYCDYNVGEQYSCTSDCSYCGDGICDPFLGEDPSSCGSDCYGPYCGDGVCDQDAGEDCGACPDDCSYLCGP